MYYSINNNKYVIILKIIPIFNNGISNFVNLLLNIIITINLLQIYFVFYLEYNLIVWYINNI